MKNTECRSTTILLIGSGRLATHLYHWNSLQINPNKLIRWDRSLSLESLYEAIPQVETVWLAISDSALVPFYEHFFINSKSKVVHFSGAVYDERLASAHPMMSFPHSLLPDSVYEKIGFAVQGADQLQNLMPGFGNEFFLIAGAEKPLYHALCVVAGNFPQLLWNEVSSNLPALKIPESMYYTYISQVLFNFIALKEKALTGPFIRNDKAIISQNEKALAGHSKLQNIYHAFKKEFSP